MADLPSGLSEAVDEAEDLARFLRSSSEYSATVVKPVAFLPDPKDADKETSVFRHGRDPRPRLWKIGADHVVLEPGRRIHGAAIFKARHAIGAGLKVVAAEPPDRHAGLRDWPWIPDDPKTQKAQQIERAQQLSMQAELVKA